MTTLGRQGGELLAQLRELLYLPGDGRRCRPGSKKRGRNDNETNNGGEEPHPHRCCSGKTRKTKQQKSKYLVTSVPDFDGYQWRKYGQKQIEGAMYARSYYRCTRSAEQGCPAKRTVQRNGDDPAKYTVVYMGEHTCTANDDSLLEAPPVILETAAAVVPASATSSSTSKQRPPQHDGDTAAINSSMAGSGIESPATSDITWSSSDRHVDDYSGLFSVYDSWAPTPASAVEMDDFTGPIRSPVHIPADGWTIDHFLLHAAI